MSTIIYNNIGLLRCELLSLDREPIWHGTDYQYTVFRLHVRGIYNPNVNAYNFAVGRSVYQAPANVLNDPTAAVPNLVAVSGAARLNLIAAAGVNGVVAPVGPAQMTQGTFGPVTDLAIRHQMMQARGWLFYAVGATPIIVSPSANQDGSEAWTDAHNGPIPLSCAVKQISGTRSFLVDFAVETYINEAALFASTASVLLSHRWTRTETIDQDFYSTITTAGVARFRTDRLLFTGAVPDDFRFFLFHPVPPRCQRIDWNIEVSEDNSAIAYRLVDRLTYLRIAVPGITRIEAFQTVGGTKPSTTSVLSHVKGKDLWGAIASRVPLTQIDITARVWGNPLIVSRKILESTAIRLIGLRLNSAITGLFGVVGGIAVAGVDIPTSARDFANTFAGSGIEISHDLAGTFVEVKCSWAVAAPSLTFNPAPGSIVSIPDVRAAFPSDDNDVIKGVLQRDLNDRNDLPYPGYLNANGTGTRGAFIRALAAAALGVPDTTPPGPPPDMRAAFTVAQMNAVPLPP